MGVSEINVDQPIRLYMSRSGEMTVQEAADLDMLLTPLGFVRSKKRAALEWYKYSGPNSGIFQGIGYQKGLHSVIKPIEGGGTKAHPCDYMAEFRVNNGEIPSKERERVYIEFEEGLSRIFTIEETTGFNL